MKNIIAAYIEEVMNVCPALGKVFLKRPDIESLQGPERLFFGVLRDDQTKRVTGVVSSHC